MDAWGRLRQRERETRAAVGRRTNGRAPRRGLSRNAIVTIALFVGLVSIAVFVSDRQEPVGTVAAATRAATLNDGDYAAIDIRDLATNPDVYKQKPIQLRGEVARIEKVPVGTYVLLSVKARDGAQRWDVWVEYGGALPGIVTQATITVFGVGDGMEGGRTAWAGRDPHLVVRADRVVP